MPETMLSKLDKLKNSIVFLACIAVWAMLFCSGVIVGTRQYRDQLSGNAGDIINIFWLAWCWLIVFTNYSITNICMLCCLASVIGGLTHTTSRENVPKLLSRGLFVYLIFVSGTIVLDTSSMADVTKEKYIRMAIVLSLFSYTVGFNPTLFEKMMAKSSSNVETAIDRGTIGQTTETTTTQTRATVTRTEEVTKPTDEEVKE